MNFIKLHNERYLTVDIFLSGNEIVMIGSPYPDCNIAYSEISISYLNKMDILPTAQHIKKIKIGDISESSAVILYKDPSINDLNTLTITVKYKNLVETRNIVRYDHASKYKLTMMTLFKQDDYLLKSWIQYYKSLGVEHFYLYYNGNSSDMKKFNKSFSTDIVTFIPWNYTYWLKFNNDPYHHAQILALHSAIYRYRYCTKWLALFDLDEYIHTKNSLSTLVDKYDDTVSEVYFLNCWADAKVDKYNLTLDKLKRAVIKYNKTRDPRPYQSKNIVNPKKIKNYGIHKAHELHGGRLVNSGLWFFHFYKFSPKNRTQNLVTNPTEIVLQHHASSIKIITGSKNLNFNGIYTISSENLNGFPFYKKDNIYQIYKWDGKWRIGQPGIKCHYVFNTFNLSDKYINVNI